jgi:undecaprenyl-diphosphatase
VTTALDLAGLRALYAGGAPHATAVWRALTFVGTGWPLLPVLLALASRELRRRSAWLLAAVAGNAVVVFVLKHVTGRVRPCNALAWAPSLENPIPTDPSLPSGHAAGSFAVAAFLAIQHPRSAVPAFAVAALVAASRVALGVHYPSDVAAGALVGALVGAAVGRWARTPERRAIERAG